MSGGFDVTKHLEYKVQAPPSAGSAAAARTVLRRVHLRAIGAVPPPGAQDRLVAALACLGALHLKPGQRVKAEGSDSSPPLFAAVSEVDPKEGGRFDAQSTSVSVDREPLPALSKVHVLPFEDAKPSNRNLTISEYVRPFFDENSDYGVGKGFEFAHKACRFQVVACEPDGPAVVSPETEVFWEGPPIRRALLKQIAVLPYAHTLPALEPGSPKPDLFADHIKQYFEQRSAGLRPGEEFVTATGVRFRVAKCDPPGAGPSKDTVVHTTGPALVACALAGCEGLATQRCGAQGCGKTLCKNHAAKVSKDGAEQTFCPEHAPSSCVLM